MPLSAWAENAAAAWEKWRAAVTPGEMAVTIWQVLVRQALVWAEPAAAAWRREEPAASQRKSGGSSMPLSRKNWFTVWGTARGCFRKSTICFLPWSGRLTTKCGLSFVRSVPTLATKGGTIFLSLLPGRNAASFWCGTTGALFRISKDMTRKRLWQGRKRKRLIF